MRDAKRAVDILKGLKGLMDKRDSELNLKLPPQIKELNIRLAKLMTMAKNYAVRQGATLDQIKLGHLDGGVTLSLSGRNLLSFMIMITEQGHETHIIIDRELGTDPEIKAELTEVANLVDVMKDLTKYGNGTWEEAEERKAKCTTKKCDKCETKDICDTIESLNHPNKERSNLIERMSAIMACCKELTNAATDILAHKGIRPEHIKINSSEDEDMVILMTVQGFPVLEIELKSPDKGKITTKITAEKFIRDDPKFQAVIERAAKSADEFHDATL